MNCKITLRNGNEFKYEPLTDLKMYYVGSEIPELLVEGYSANKSNELPTTFMNKVFDRFTFDKNKTVADPIKIEFY